MPQMPNAEPGEHLPAPAELSHVLVYVAVHRLIGTVFPPLSIVGSIIFCNLRVSHVVLCAIWA